jgi:hypothetical protein
MPGDEPFAAAREKQLDALGDLISENVDHDALLRLICEGPRDDLPLVALRLVGTSAGRQKAPDGGILGTQASPSANGVSRHEVGLSAPGGNEQRKEAERPTS